MSSRKLYCFVCSNQAAFECGCCRDVVYCGKACQQIDYTHVHKYERRTRGLTGHYGVTMPGIDDSKETSNEPAKRVESQTKMTELINLSKTLNTEYANTVRRLNNARREENIRLISIRNSRNRSREEKARFEKIELIQKKREESERWSLHDDYDRMVSTLVDLMTDGETGTKPVMGIYEELYMAYTKRQLSLVWLNRKLAYLTRDVKRLEAVLAMEDKINEDTSRFLHTCLLGDTVDYETTKRESQMDRLAVHTGRYIDFQWDVLVNSMAKKASEYINDRINGKTEMNLVEPTLDTVDMVLNKGISIMDMSSSTFIAKYDSRLRKSHEDGLITEEVWRNSTNVYRNLYESLRSRGMRLVKRLIKYLTQEDGGGGSTFSSSPSMAFGVTTRSGPKSTTTTIKTRDRRTTNTTSTTTNDNDDDDDGDDNGIGSEDETLFTSFKEKIDAYLPDWKTKVLIIGGMIGLLIAFVHFFITPLTGLIPSLVEKHSPMSDTPADNPTNVTPTDNPTNAPLVDTSKQSRELVPVTSEQIQREASKNLSGLTVEKMREMTVKQRSDLEASVSNLRGRIDECRTTDNSVIDAVSEQQWLGYAAQPSFVDDHLVHANEQLRSIIPGFDGNLRDLTSEDVIDNEDIGDKDFVVWGLRRISIAYDKYNADKDDPTKSSTALRKLVDVFKSYYQPGENLKSKWIGEWSRKRLAVLEPMLACGDNHITPMFNTMASAVDNAVERLDNATTNKGRAEAVLNATMIRLNETNRAWETMRLASDMLVDKSAASLFHGLLYAFCYTNGVVRLGYGIKQMYNSVDDQIKFCVREGVSLDTCTSKLNFTQNITTFILILYSAQQFGRGFGNILVRVPAINRLVWSALKTKQTEREIKEIVDDLVKYDGQDARLVALTTKWDDDVVDNVLYNALSEAVYTGKLDDLAKGTITLSDINPLAVLTNSMVSKLTQTIHRPGMDIPRLLFQQATWLIGWVLFAQKLQNAIYAFMYTVSIAYEGLSGLIGLGLVATSLSPFVTVEPSIMAIWIGRIILLTATTTASVVGYLFRDELIQLKKKPGDIPKQIFHIALFLMSTIVYPILVQSDRFGADFGKFMDNYALSPQKWAMLLEDTPYAISKNISDTKIERENAQEAFNTASNVVNQLQWPDNELYNRFTSNYTYFSDFLFAVDENLGKKTTYIDNVHQLQSSSREL